MNYLFTAASYLKPKQYEYTNIHHVYNTLLLLFELTPNDVRESFVDIIRLQMGVEFTKAFKQYLFEKVPNCELIKYL